MTPLGFRYHPNILSHFPEICGGVILLHGFTNRPTPDKLLETYLVEQKHVRDMLGDRPLSEIPSLSAWRATFRQFGVDPTKYRSAAEALLRRLTKKGDIPSISALVDLCNLVSIRYALPVAAFDARSFSGPITVLFATGSESFTAHDSPEPEHPEAGEVIFMDESGAVAARRWCWKQSVESTVGLDTTTAVLTLEAQHEEGHADIQNGLSDLGELLADFVGGNQKVALLDRLNPGIFG